MAPRVSAEKRKRIVYCLKVSDMTKADIARLFNVSESQVGRIGREELKGGLRGRRKTLGSE